MLVCVGQLERSAGFYVVVGGVGNNETVFRYEHRECVAKYAKRLRASTSAGSPSPWPDYYASLIVVPAMPSYQYYLKLLVVPGVGVVM